MGCFDFTYADNGRNIRGERGYMYLMPHFGKCSGLGPVLRFTGMEEYGMLICPLCKDGSNVLLDIYALYGAMLNFTADDPDGPENHDVEAEKYMEIIRQRSFHEYTSLMKSLSDTLRKDGINYFFDHQKKYGESLGTVTVQEIGNMKKKRVVPQNVFVGKTPLLVTRNKLFTSGCGLRVAAKHWGFVTDCDPKQGAGPTRNHYSLFQPSNAKRPGWSE